MADSVGFTKSFGPIRFSRWTLADMFESARSMLGAAEDRVIAGPMSVTRGSETWTLTTLEQFFVEIGNGYDSFWMTRMWDGGRSLNLSYSGAFRVAMNAPDRDTAQSVAQMIQGKLSEGEVVAVDVRRLRVFIGHGRSDAWKDLKDHLADVQHIDVEAYEVASRSGYSIREVLDSMLDKATMAFLVMTAEDEQGDGGMRARQNVVHEAGLFQGRLGFPRAIILKESTVDLFTNVDGIQYIEFETGHIRECFGEVLGVVEREFPAVR
jgi:predicted nucleotide-binding protein